jgi:hypothetical protein
VRQGTDDQDYARRPFAMYTGFSKQFYDHNEYARRQAERSLNDAPCTCPSGAASPGGSSSLRDGRGRRRMSTSRRGLARRFGHILGRRSAIVARAKCPSTLWAKTGGSGPAWVQGRATNTQAGATQNRDLCERTNMNSLYIQAMVCRDSSTRMLTSYSYPQILAVFWR